MRTIITHTVEETEQAGFCLADELEGRDPLFVALYGDLGAGKTAFVRGFVEKLSAGSRVKSPTYTIVNEYRKGSRPVFHFDLYRVEDSDELLGFGFEEYVQNGICITEWSENIADEIPQNAVKVRILKSGETERAIEIELGDN
jgi:tRNA threonylcarbamoyladenosine biosynthesis protein TsaE